MAQARKATSLTVPVTEQDAQSGFKCGNHDLEDFLCRHAVGNDQKFIGKTFVLHPNPGNVDVPRVLGYYTLSMGEIVSVAVSNTTKYRLPKYPMPVAVIGRLAVHETMHGHGLGKLLLGEALSRILMVTDLIGCFGVIVDAKDERAMAFYERHGFSTLATTALWPRRMFLPIQTLKVSSRP